MTRPDSTSALMSRSESSTLATYRFRAGTGSLSGLYLGRRPPGRPSHRHPRLPQSSTASGTMSGQVASAGGIISLGGDSRSRGCSSMAERQLPKLIVRVRFSSPARYPESAAQTPYSCCPAALPDTPDCGWRARCVPDRRGTLRASRIELPPGHLVERRGELLFPFLAGVQADPGCTGRRGRTGRASGADVPVSPPQS